MRPAPGGQRPAHLHHLPVLSSVERVQLVGSHLVGSGRRGAVVFTPALRHVLLGPRESLLVSWGDGVRERRNLHKIHTMFSLLMSPLVNWAGTGPIRCDNYSKNLIKTSAWLQWLATAVVSVSTITRFQQQNFPPSNRFCLKAAPAL